MVYTHGVVYMCLIAVIISWHFDSASERETATIVHIQSTLTGPDFIPYIAELFVLILLIDAEWK